MPGAASSTTIFPARWAAPPTPGVGLSRQGTALSQPPIDTAASARGAPGALQARGALDARVMEVNPLLDRRWEAFVRDHPGATVYHHPAWLQVLQAEYPQPLLGLALEDPGGELQGVLPLVATRGLPLRRQALLTGRRLSSLPRTPVAGPLARDRAGAQALARAALERAASLPGVRLELKTDDDSLAASHPHLVRVPWRMTYVLRLPRDPASLRFGGSRNHTRIKWAVNKAARSGVVVREAENEADLRAWYTLYLAVMRWHVVPPRPYRLFQAAWEQLRPRGMLRLLLAEQDSGGQRRLLAGSVFLMFGATVFYAFNGRRREDLALRPNDVLQWHAIHLACREGYRAFDFGEVAEGNQGLADFKGKWGAEERRLTRFYFPAPPPARPDRQAGGHLRALGRAAWQRLPLPLTAQLGDCLYSYL